MRRFMLYDVLLHELGHLQTVDRSARRWDARFASETLPQRFADELREELWSATFDHLDPVHNPPSDEELDFIPVWQA